ncbi:hypothetical protein N8766_01345 [bacterium]|jgi:hypothetical protein|nr:hypothetical protein [bacterium]MDA7680496.1 hypothetical protein [bacterium]
MNPVPSSDDRIEPSANSAVAEKGSGDASASTRQWTVIKGLLWSEWFAHSKMLLVFLVLWLLGAWMIPFVAHPGWILAIGLGYALLAGPAYGGTDAIEGCEEFTLSLPATRSERYLARMSLGIGTLAMFVGLDFIVLGLDWTATIHRVFINAGIMEATPDLKPGLLYGLAIGLPFFIFSFSYSLSSVARNRFLILSSWFWSVILALCVLYGGLKYEEIMWQEPTGYFCTSLFFIGGVASLWSGFRLYQQKEVGHYGAPISLPQWWWAWLLSILIGVAVAAVLVSSLVQRFPDLLSR